MIKKGMMLIARRSFTKRGGKLLYGFKSISGKNKINPVSSFYQVSFYPFFTKKSNNIEEFENKVEEKVRKSTEMKESRNFEGAKQLIEELVEECEAFYKIEKYPNWQMHKLGIALCCINMECFQKAETLLKQIISDLDQNCSNEKDNLWLFQAFSNLATINTLQGNLLKAFEYKRRANQIIKENSFDSFDETTKNLLIAIKLVEIGELQILLSQIQEAITSFEESIILMEDIFQRLHHDEEKNELIPSLSKAYERLGMIHMSLDNKELCENYFKSAVGLHIQMKGEDSLFIAQIYANLALVNIRYTEWDNALNNLKKGQKILDKAKKTDQALEIEGHLNYVFLNYHKARGEPEKAFKYLNIIENMMEECEKNSVFDQKEIISLKLGILRDQGKYEEMEKILEEALILNKTICKDKENEDFLYSIYHNYAYVFLRKKDFEKAIDYSWKTYNIAASNVGMGDEYCCGDALVTIFNAYNLQKKWPEAIEHGNRAIEILKKKPHKRSNAEKLILDLSCVYSALGDKINYLLYLKEFKNMLLEDLANASEESQAVIKMRIEDVDAKISKTETDIL